jgi:hypothetical protein
MIAIMIETTTEIETFWTNKFPRVRKNRPGIPVEETLVVGDRGIGARPLGDARGGQHRLGGIQQS